MEVSVQVPSAKWSIGRDVLVGSTVDFNWQCPSQTAGCRSPYPSARTTSDCGTYELRLLHRTEECTQKWGRRRFSFDDERTGQNLRGSSGSPLPTSCSSILPLEGGSGPTVQDTCFGALGVTVRVNLCLIPNSFFTSCLRFGSKGKGKDSQS